MGFVVPRFNLKTLNLKTSLLSSLKLTLITTFLLTFVPISQANPIVARAKALESQHGGTVGIAIINSSDGSEWHYNGDLRFPMMSTFKTLACGHLLAHSEQQLLDPKREFAIVEEDLIQHSPVTKDLVGKNISLEKACHASLTTSDNTAANVILEGIGGPQALTAFLRTIGDDVTRLDRIEPHLNEALAGDHRDTTTPLAITKTLQALLTGEVLSDSSRDQLTQWLVGNRVSDMLLRSVLADDWSIADRSGAGRNGSRGITAMIWKAEEKPLFISIYMTGTSATFDELNQAIAELGRDIFTHHRINSQ